MTTLKTLNKQLKNQGINVYMERDRFSKKVTAYVDDFVDGQFIEPTDNDYYAKDVINEALQNAKNLRDITYLSYFTK